MTRCTCPKDPRKIVKRVTIMPPLRADGVQVVYLYDASCPAHGYRVLEEEVTDVAAV